MKINKAIRVTRALKLLNKNGIEYEELNERTGHYRFGDWDFWPSTGTLYNIKTRDKGSGKSFLLMIIENEKTKRKSFFIRMLELFGLIKNKKNE